MRNALNKIDDAASPVQGGVLINMPYPDFCALVLTTLSPSLANDPVKLGSMVAARVELAHTKKRNRYTNDFMKTRATTIKVVGRKANQWDRSKLLAEIKEIKYPTPPPPPSSRPPLVLPRLGPDEHLASLKRELAEWERELTQADLALVIDPNDENAKSNRHRLRRRISILNGSRVDKCSPNKDSIPQAEADVAALRADERRIAEREAAVQKRVEEANNTRVPGG